MDAIALSELAQWLRTIPSGGLRWAFLPMPESGSHAIGQFNHVYKAYTDNWTASVHFSEEGASERRYSDAFISANRIVVIFDQTGIVATGTIYHLDLLNASHCVNSILAPLGTEWISQHLAENSRTLYYCNHLSANLDHSLIGNKGLFGRLYVTMMLRSFLDSGFDMASCHLRRRTGMDSHGDFVGGRKEVTIRPMGLEENDVLDVATITRDMGLFFPFKALGKPFAEMWETRCTTWEEFTRARSEAQSKL